LIRKVLFNPILTGKRRVDLLIPHEMQFKDGFTETITMMMELRYE
jgi:hypothetical protein